MTITGRGNRIRIENSDEPTLLQLVINGEYSSAEGATASRGTLKSGIEMFSRLLKMRRDL
ncbi:MAG: hypothetical protein U5K56_17640 [Halioglobus sp.]|nr:hypothetical protein [Halioglobus sp.]